MPQLRKDPIVKRWVIVAQERARRPAAFIDSARAATDRASCPFCHDQSQKEVYAHDGVRVVKSGTPILDNTRGFERKRHGLYDVSHSYGSHEVLIETPEHIANMADLSVDQIRHVFETYALRMKAHQQDKNIHYVLAYKNYGVAAGSRNIGHARSQIMAVPILPVRVKDKIRGAKKYYDSHKSCVVCDMVRQELADHKRVVASNDAFVAISPFAARFPFETWIVPRLHHCHYTQGIEGCAGPLAQIMKEVLVRFQIGLDDPAYNYVIQSAPFKDSKAEGHKYPTIEQDYHWHIELIPRLTRVAGFERGSGFYICPIPPEMSAQFLREV